MYWYGPRDGVTDCAPYINGLTASLGSSYDKVLEIPSGVYAFKTPLAPLPQMQIIGQGKLSTILIKRFHGGNFFQSNGTKGNGLIIERLCVLADTAYTPGNFCYLYGAPASGVNFQADNFQLRELYVSQSGAITGSSPAGGGLWQNGVLVDGNSRTYPDPQGMRIGVIENCEIFNCISSGVWIRNGVGIRMTGGGCYPGSAGGQYPNGTGIFVTGAPALAITGASGPTGGLASITTNGQHRLVAGAPFQIAGATPSGWNGSFVATPGTGVNQINFALAGSPGGMSVLGNVTVQELNSVGCQFTDVINNCVLNISRSSLGSWTGGLIGSLATDDSSRWRIDTTCTGAVANNLLNSTVNLNLAA